MPGKSDPISRCMLDSNWMCDCELQSCWKKPQKKNFNFLSTMMTQQMMNHGNTNQLIILCLFFLAEIADNASLSVEETGSSATESTDSIGSLRNSSPENAEKCVMREKNRSSDAMSRLSPMVTGNT